MDALADLLAFTVHGSAAGSDVVAVSAGGTGVLLGGRVARRSSGDGGNESGNGEDGRELHFD